MADIIGTYEMVSSENFDKFLEACGVGFVMRKMATSIRDMKLEITKNGEEYCIKQITKMKTTEIRFVLGEETVDKTMDGREIRSEFSLDGKTLTQVQHGVKDPEFVNTITRVFTVDGMTATLQIKDVSAVRKYKKLA